MNDAPTGPLRARVRAAISATATLRGIDGPDRTETATVPLDAAADAVMAVIREKPPKPDPAPPTVGDALRRTLKSLGISQVVLARVTGLTAKHVNQVIGGKAALSPDVAVKLAHATGTPAAVWLGIQGARLEWESRTLQDDPACSECGGRPKHGLIQSEDGQTWQCEGCYADLASGPEPSGGEG